MLLLKPRGQAALEYLLLIGGVLLFIVFILVLLRGGLLPKTTNKISSDVESFYDKWARYYLFFDNFDTGTSYRWENDTTAWSVQNTKYVSTGSGKSMVERTLSNFSINAFVQTSSTFGFVLRYRNASNYYNATLNSGGTAQLIRYSNSNPGGLVLDSGTPAEIPDMAAGAYFRVDANGTNFTVFVNNQLVFWEEDASEPLGWFGVYSSGASVVDDVYVFDCAGQCGVGA